MRIQRVGRDMPGSNWHTYVYDPDGHTNELYYGIEQIGWIGSVKPRSLYYRGFQEKPPLPQMSEAAELNEATAKGIDVLAGHKPNGNLRRDLRCRGRPAGAAVQDHQDRPGEPLRRRCRYRRALLYRRLGFLRSEEATYRGARCVFLRCGAEHHTLGLFPKELRKTLGLSERSSLHVVWHRARQLRATPRGGRFLKSRGVEIIDAIPPELYPGIDYSAFALDPDGHCIQLYYYMEQIGWDGRVRPASARARYEPWPEALEAARRHLSGPGVPGAAGYHVG